MWDSKPETNQTKCQQMRQGVDLPNSLHPQTYGCCVPSKHTTLNTIMSSCFLCEFQSWHLNLQQYEQLEWNFLVSLSVFPPAVDIISAIEFDKTGDHLATGDYGGRVVLIERTDTKDVCSFCPNRFHYMQQ